ncbi:protein TolB [Streptomyces sp. S3(2020)]|uniref:protein TolB n=1 Tax=Streptomyces sp. S3(2020) TaxID=2732044 RepID=UPI001487635F|nr:protein TolB [Streptomyces sp. S3(2020)]NNN31733.1 protein TolB [Streptomyces sp. S3(2020)]
MSRAVRVSSVSLSAALLLTLTATTAGAEPHAPRVHRVSTAADGTQADGASTAATTTPNGRFVAFRSSATNLVPEGITHPGTYAYIRDLRTGEVTKIEAALSTPRLSADGRWATYTDWGIRKINVFLTDLTTGTRIRVGGDAQDSAGSPDISANGRYIAYTWSGHPQFPTRIDVYDRETGTHETVSAGPADSARDMGNASVSGDGRQVAYQDNGTGDVWVADRTTGTQTEADDGTPSTVVQLSADGRVLAMDSADGSYVRELRTGRVQHFPGVRVLAVSPDGQRLLLRDGQSNLTLRTLRGGHETPVGRGSAGERSVSAHGRSVVYATEDADVVPGDTNGVYDVFQWRSR